MIASDGEGYYLGVEGFIYFQKPLGATLYRIRRVPNSLPEGDAVYVFALLISSQS